MSTDKTHRQKRSTAPWPISAPTTLMSRTSLASQIRCKSTKMVVAPYWLARPNGGVAYIVRPGRLVGGEIATLVDRGYQKFLRTSRHEVAATAAHLRALHAFDEELFEAVGTPDYYNLALGTVSDLYLYDRLKGREPEGNVPPDAH